MNEVECEQTSWLHDAGFLREFNKKVYRERVPISGYLELTRRCNMHCVHCFIGSQARVREKAAEELHTAGWLRILDEITAAGCLRILLTGGEPLLRKDFAEIYRHAKNNGLLTTVFTNGTLIEKNSPILELFSDLPPQTIEITLYGATAATYEKITGVKGSFEKCQTGIRLLLEAGLNLKLKTMLMSLNGHEFEAMKQMAAGYGCRFRFDGALFPGLDGAQKPLELRLDADDIAAQDFAEEKKAGNWQDFYKRMRSIPAKEYIYICGAGHNHFHIDPYGRLTPCVLVTNLDYDLTGGSFSQGWNEVMPLLRERQASPANTCKNCEKISICGYCPAFFKLESGDENIAPAFICRLGEARMQQIMKKG